MEVKEEENDPLTFAAIGAAIEVHRVLGPGLLESAYEECLAYEFTERGISFHRQMVMPVVYKKIKLRDAYRLDFLIQDQLVLELKATDRKQEVHEAQLLTYLKLSGIKKGLLINFQVPMLKLGIRRFIM
jgi:GxxExxY protein